MFRYTQDCPECTMAEENSVPCSRCGGMGELVITEMTNGDGVLEISETPIALDLAGKRMKYSLAMEAFEESVGYTQALDPSGPQYEFIYHDELAEDIAPGSISDPVLVYGIPKETHWAKGMRSKDTGHYVIVWGEFGLYLLLQGQYVHIDFTELEAVNEKADRLILEFITPADEEPKTLEVMRTSENHRYLRDLRIALTSAIEEDAHRKSMQSLLLYYSFHRHIGKLSKQGQEYSFELNARPRTLRSPLEKRLHQVLFSYAAKIRRPHVLAFVDASGDGSGERGIVFSQDGLAFCNGKNYGYVPYESIRFMTTNKRKTALSLHGFFDECLKPCKKVTFSSAEYHIDALESCFQELLLYI